MISISVVCPTYNSADFVERTLETVLSQSRLPDELIISDDGSSDGTSEVVERYLARNGASVAWQIVQNAHRGPGATRNAGISQATGDWVAFLDSDDLWEPRKLERMAVKISEVQTANFFCHDEQRIKKNGKVSPLVYGRRYRSSSPLTPQLYFANMFSTSAVICRRDLLTRHLGFNEGLMSAQDYELWLRLSPSIKPVFVHEVLGKYVEREGNITSGKLVKRMYNEFRIAWMHRGLVTPLRLFARLSRIILSYIKQYIIAL